MKAKILELLAKAKLAGPVLKKAGKKAVGMPLSAVEFGIWLAKFLLERLWPKKECKPDESPKRKDWK